MALRDIFWLVVKLFAASLVVGLVFRALNIHPQRLLRDIPDVVLDVFRLMSRMVDWAIPYVMLGAMIVVPVWALYMLFRLVKRR